MKFNDSLFRNKMTVFIIIPIIFVLIAFLSYYHKHFEIIGNQQEQIFKIGTLKIDTTQFANQIKEENTTIEEFSTSKLCYKYKLLEGTEIRHLATVILKKDDKLMDLSVYDFIKIKIKATKGKRIWLHLGSEIKNYSNIKDLKTYKYYSSTLNLKPEYSTIEIPIDYLKTPRWWYYFNKIDENQIIQSDLSLIKYICLTNCMEVKFQNNLLTEDKIEVSSFVFYVNMNTFYLYTSIFLALYYLLAIYIFIRITKTASVTLNFNYKKTVTEDQSFNEERLLLDFLIQNYQQHELSIIDVQKATLINERKISAIIKRKFDLNFKYYLNQIRINEAKKLLINSKLSISEISFLVGYSNSTHFNRVFKMLESCSPNEFRKSIFDSTIL